MVLLILPPFVVGIVIDQVVAFLPLFENMLYMLVTLVVFQPERLRVKVEAE